jgi:transketolase
VRHEERFEVGRAELVEDGSDVAVLTHGTLFTEGFHACSILRERGVSTGLLNLRTLVPLDEDAVLEALWSARLVVTLEDHFTRGGLASSLAELLMRHRLTARVLPLSLDTWFRPALLADVLAFEGFTPERIAQRILEELDR